MKMRGLLAAVLIALAACSNAEPKPSLISSLEQLASQGNAEATYHLGMIYWTGTGATKDPKRAVSYFEHAAAAGDPLASYKMGCIWDGQDGVFQRDPEKALRYKLVAANAGYALAQEDVAALYAERNEIPLALEWITKAAKQGTSGALESYASVYNGAPGVTPDPVKTAAYFRLFLERTDATDQQKKWLGSFEAKLSPEQRRQVREMVANYRAAPTPLTIKALRGIERAEELAASAK